MKMIGMPTVSQSVSQSVVLWDGKEMTRISECGLRNKKYVRGWVLYCHVAKVSLLAPNNSTHRYRYSLQSDDVDWARVRHGRVERGRGGAMVIFKRSTRAMGTLGPWDPLTGRRVVYRY